MKWKEKEKQTNERLTFFFLLENNLYKWDILLYQKKIK